MQLFSEKKEKRNKKQKKNIAANIPAAWINFIQQWRERWQTSGQMDLHRSGSLFQLLQEQEVPRDMTNTSVKRKINQTV